MNRSVCRVMMGIAGSAVLGMSATLAGAQTVEVKENPPLYRYVSYWTLPRAHWADVDKDHATGNQQNLAPALADGTLVGYGEDENQVHSAEGFTHDSTTPCGFASAVRDCGTAGTSIGTIEARFETSLRADSPSVTTP